LRLRHARVGGGCVLPRVRRGASGLRCEGAAFVENTSAFGIRDSAFVKDRPAFGIRDSAFVLAQARWPACATGLACDESRITNAECRFSPRAHRST
ncbi:MAG: hypothetical protein ACK46I_06390, partial [Phycisphaerae bacterium]